jgi:hypothetical protein
VFPGEPRIPGTTHPVTLARPPRDPHAIPGPATSRHRTRHPPPTSSNLLRAQAIIDFAGALTRTVEHTHQEEKISALRNAVLNSVAPEAPDTDTQAIFLNFVDRFTPSHLRLVTLWDDPPAWFSSHGISPPEGAFVGSRTATVETGLPEMQGQKDFYLLIASELGSAGMLTANLSGMVSPTAILDRLTTDFGRQFVRFISPRST